MGNNMGGVANSKAPKIMKINGEFFKPKTPSKVPDIIKDYPDHILLDSQDFLRFNLRAKPLSPDHELKPRKIYLLVELPKFPKAQSPLRRVRSGVLVSRGTSVKNNAPTRSNSDITIETGSTVGVGDDDHDGVGPTRVKMRLPKAQVQKIMEESGDDDVEVARRILRLCFEGNGAVSREVADVVDRDSGGESDVERHRGLCSPCYSYRSKCYKKLAS